MVQRSAETAKIEQAFGSAIEGNAHAVEQVDDAGRGLAHVLHRRLVGEEVAPVNGVIEVLPGAVALAFEVLGGVDSALRAHGMRALHRHNREQIDMPAGFGDLDGRGEPRKAATYDNDFRISHKILKFRNRVISKLKVGLLVLGFQITRLRNYTITKFLHCTCCPSTCLAVAGSVPRLRHSGFWGETNARTVTMPTTTNRTPIAKQITPALRRAFSPETIPHLAQNSHIPYAKCQEAQTMAIT